MYHLTTNHSFDSAHFLAVYEGKCSNIHGHRWKVVVTVQSMTLQTNKQQNGMLVDFSQLKNDLKEEVDSMDHALIIERNTLKPNTLSALQDEGFQIIMLDFRPTAENLAKYFYNQMKRRGYQVKTATVYETPNNCASYEEESDGAI
jgi:6-pyruvoyltetrahydropterin/6-carboxytetrahydropterin synthase